MNTGDDLQRVRAVFQAAIDLPVPDRDGYVAEACRGNEALRDRVLKLLLLDGDSLPLLDSPLFDLAMNRALDATRVPSIDTLLDTEVGGCHIRKRIGAGGMGVVYEAEQLSTGRPVAVKLIDDLRMSADVLWRFRREIAVLGRLDHPGIARLYDAGMLQHNGNDRPYFVMELVSGSRTVTQYVDDQRLGVHERLGLFRQICEAVASGHQCGIVHRDLKPGNILATADGCPKVIDFGVAGALEGNEPGLEATINKEQIVGSLYTIAPEQFDTSRSVPDVRSDVYSLGVVLFELLTGEPAVQLKSTSFVGAAREIVRATPRRLSQVNPRLRGDLDAICAMALARDPRFRYQSVRDLADDLDRYLTGNEVRARAAERMYRLRCSLRRHRVPVTVALLLIGALSVATLTYKKLYDRTNAQQRQLIAQSEALRISNYHNLIALADSALKGENLLEVRELLEQCPDDLRRWEWQYLHGALDNSVETLPVPMGCRPDSISPGGTRLVGIDVDRTTASVVDVASGETLWSLSFGADIIDRLVWSHDGASVAICRRSTSSLIVDSANGNILVELRSVTRVAGEFDASVAIACATPSTVYAWSPTGAPLENELFTIPSPPRVLRVSPDGRLLAAGCHDGTVVVYDNQTGKVLMRSRAHGGICDQLEFSADLQHIITCAWDGRVHVWDLATGQRERTLAEEAFRPSVRLSGSGDIVAYSDRGTIILCESLSGDEVIRLRGLDSAVSHIGWGADDRTLIAASATQVKTWDLAQTGSFALQPSGHTGWIDCLAYSNSGTWLATYGREGKLILRDADSQQTVATADAPPSRMIWVGFAPDDGYLVGRTTDGSIHIWEVPSLRFVLSRETGGGGFGFAAWLNELTLLTPGPRGELLAIAIPKGEIVDRLRTGQSELRAIAISDDKSTLVTASPEPASGSPGVIVWRATDEGFVKSRELMQSTGVMSVLLSPGNEFIVSGGADGIVRTWDLPTGEEITVMKGHQDLVYWLDFVDDASRIVSSEYPGGIRIWDTASGRSLLDLEKAGSRFDVHPLTEVIVTDHTPSLAFYHH